MFILNNNNNDKSFDDTVRRDIIEWEKILYEDSEQDGDKFKANIVII